jgi:hypothetical protein
MTRIHDDGVGDAGRDLVALGLPVKAPDAGGFSLPAGAVGGIAARSDPLALLISGALRVRRRPQPIPAWRRLAKMGAG